ncbi:MAG: Kelch repeat-containing protein, partial [Blastocatellia bacterium]
MTSAVGKLWHGLSHASTKTTKEKKTATGKAAAPAKTRQQETKQAGEAGDLNIGRRGHTATPLADGKLLIIGGENESGQVSQTELFDPDSRKFSLAARSITPRAEHTATTLRDGRILVIGGRNEDRSLDSSEIYDSEKEAFSYGPTMTYSRSGHTATLLADGRVFVAGGDPAGSAEIYDPERQTFTPVEGQLNAPRADHAATLLKNGRVLIAGGRTADGKPLLSGELFDPATLSFSLINTPLHIARVRPSLRVLPDGKVQVIGGDDEITMEMFNAETVRFTAYGHLLDDPDALPAVLRAPTRAALVHSRNAFAVGAPRARIPDDSLGKMFDRNGSSFTELPQSGQVVVIGGLNSSGKYLSSAVALNTCSLNPAPTVTTDKTDYTPGMKVVITGAGWTPGETVSMVLHREPETLPDTTLSSQANSTGGFTNNSYTVQMADVGVTFTLTATGQTSGCTAQTNFTDAPASVDLDQVRNGTAASPVTPGDFQNGNLGASQSHYLEGHSVPYRAVMENLPISTTIELTLGYDIRNSGKHALDYLTHYNRLLPHTFLPAHLPEVIDPTIGVAGVSGSPTSTFAIPAPVPPVLRWRASLQ